MTPAIEGEPAPRSPWMHSRGLIVGLAGVVGLLAGCGDGDGSSSTTTAPSTSSTIAASTSSVASTTSTTGAFTGTPAAGVDTTHLCTVLTIADLNNVLKGGFEVTNAPTDDDGCTYYTAPGRQSGRAQATLEIRLTGAKSYWQEPGGHYDTPFSGLGEMAFTSKSGDFTRVEALKGDTEVELGIGNGVTATDDQYRTLINLAFQRLGR